MGSLTSFGGPIPPRGAEVFPSEQDLARLFRLRFQEPEGAGWSVRRRLRPRYYVPDEYYGALVEKVVQDDTFWLDVGAGSTLFPSNRPLSRLLARRCRHILVVDPSPNVHHKPYAHERVQCRIEDYQTDHVFDLATLRMVAEHLEDPPGGGCHPAPPAEAGRPSHPLHGEPLVSGNPCVADHAFQAAPSSQETRLGWP